MTSAPTAPTKPPAIDARLIVPFISSVKSVMSTMAGIETTIDKLRMRTSPGSEYDYSGIIGFSGEIIGTVVVSFHRETAMKIVTAFAGSELEPDTSDFADAIGELANMIAGAAKKDLGVTANISTPNVVSGKGHIVSHPSGIPSLVIPCKTALGEFAVEVSIKSV